MGGNITFLPGGKEVANHTTLDCTDLGNNFHYVFSVINEKGAVVKGQDRQYLRIYGADHEQGGFELYRKVNDHPVVAPGEVLEHQIGDHRISIQGTDTPGVMFNGAAPARWTKEQEIQRYPH